MMPRHPYRRQTSYTHPVGTFGIIVAAAIYVGIFLAFMVAIAPSFIVWP